MDLNNIPIVLYDGECGFCNRSVAFVVKRDKTKTIHFAAIQSEFTKDLFERKGWKQPDLSTFYLVENDMLAQKSNAALKVFLYFKMPYSMFSIFRIVPRFIRDYVYDFIAKRRQKISKGFCVVPTEEEYTRFIQ
jgi:predicted DCC family thiol-disulfide oxidoreductase YuxK